MLTASQAKMLADDMLEVGHFALERVSWDFYTYILDRREETGAWARITYDRGMMEVYTGGDVEGLMRDGLARMLERFSFAEKLSVEEITLRLNKKRERHPDEIYSLMISYAPKRKDEPGPKSVGLTLTRSVLEPSTTDPERSVLGAPQLSLKGTIDARMDAGKLIASPDSALYPGIDVADHFAFIWTQRKEVTK